MSQKFTSKVRRGFAWLVAQGLANHVETFITNGTRLGLKRGERLTAAEIEDIRAAVAYIGERADIGERAEADAADPVAAIDSALAESNIDDAIAKLKTFNAAVREHADQLTFDAVGGAST